MKLRNIIFLLAADSYANPTTFLRLESQCTAVELCDTASQSVNLTRKTAHSSGSSNVFPKDTNAVGIAPKNLFQEFPLTAKCWELNSPRNRLHGWKNATAEQIPIAIGYMKRALGEVEVRKLPQDALKWAMDHPTQMATYVAWIGYGATICFPEFVSKPVLRALGFSLDGPRSRAIAAILQSKLTRVVAKSAFAQLQSTGMGGSGAAVVNVVTRVGAAASGVVGRFTSSISSEEAEAASAVPEQVARDSPAW